MACRQEADKVFDVLVVGAGPAGIAATLALQQRDVAWVDPQFAAGRLARLRAVPCNTKVDLLAGPCFFRHPLLASVRERVEPAVERLISGAHPLPSLAEPCELGFTHLGDCKEVYDAATGALLDRDSVTAVRGSASSLAWQGDCWTASVALAGEARASIRARCVVLATGCKPRATDRENAIHLEDAFDLPKLSSRLRQRDRVAVLGNSHSAAIVLSNLHSLRGSHSLQIANFARRPVRLAEWDGGLGTYRYNSTGLKGAGASFGQEHMVPGSTSIQILPASSFDGAQWDWVVDCTGYVPEALPAVSGSSAYWERCEASGRLGVELGAAGLFGVGAPWPEPPGRLWGNGLEQAEGFKSEGSFIGFHLFFYRSVLIAEEIEKLLGDPAGTSAEAKAQPSKKHSAGAAQA